MKVDPRFLAEEGREIFSGNELLVKGALETEGGVHLFTGYPGSPIAGFFDCLEGLAPLLESHGQVARLANNEALSMAMVNGAQMAGCRAITAMKSVGVHVASDALALGVLAGTRAGSGGLVVMGDDPWSDSTQVPADSRYLAEHCRLPVIEPATPQEVKDWVDLAFKIGQAGQIYTGYLVTVTQADGGGTVACRPNRYPSVNERQKRALRYDRDIEPELENTVLLPPRTWQRELGLEARFAEVVKAAREHGVNRVLHRPQKGERAPLGVIVAGSAWGYYAHALGELGLAGQLPTLKLGMPYPVDGEMVADFLGRCEQVIVIEERRGFVERQVLEVANERRQRGEAMAEVYGKRFPGDLAGIPETRGLNPSLLIERLVPLLRAHPTLPVELTDGTLTRHLDRIRATADYEVSIPSRTPTFCPGCPHRDSSSVLMELRQDLADAEYMLNEHKRQPVDLVAHGDTGCYTMLMFEPTKPLMHNYSGMGLGGGTGSGVDPFIENKQLVFMGDGTFFHSGQAAISHSIYAGQDITYIILDNKTTAMTGHQVNAAVEHDLMGRPTFAQDIERIVKAMVPAQIAKDVRVVRADPADRDRYRRLLEQTILADGVKVIIADKECGITFHRRARRAERQEIAERGFLPEKTHMNVATEVCENCLECTNQTGCPGLKPVQTDYGPKIQTDFSWCVNDGACHRIDACPSFEEVTVRRQGPPRMGDEHVHLSDLPEPPRPIHADQDTWRCYLAGVGGMGIGLSTAILTAAGHAMGYQVRFLDKKGLAIRNGGVFSQLVYTRGEAAEGGAGAYPTTPVIPYGGADLMIGVDLLEAARGIDPAHPYRVASPQRTAAVLNTAKTPTILSLMGREDFDPETLERTIARYTKDGRCFGFNVGDLCERVLDSKLYANIMMLGIAYQLGYLPLSGEAIDQAIRQIARQEPERNLRAFAIGRKIAVRPDLFVVESQHEFESSRQTLRRKVNTIRKWWASGQGEQVARRFRVLCRRTFRAVRGHRVDDALIRDVIIRAYDCVIWGGVDYAKRYCNRLVEVFRRDPGGEAGYRLTWTVVWNLAKVMLIKDEVYVASLLTSPEKYKRDRRRFNVNPERGDRIIYRHYNRPEFELFGQKIRFRFRSRDWQLRIMAGCRWLRGLLPAWHRREREFRDWYEGLVVRCLEEADLADPREYRRWVAVLSVPEMVTGYREVRYPKMQAARVRAEKLLAADPSVFDGEAPEPPEAADAAAVSLPVLAAG